MQILVDDLSQRQKQLSGFRDSFASLENLEEFKSLSSALTTTLKHLQDDLDSATTQANIRLKSLQVHPQEQNEITIKTKQTLVEFLTSPWFIFHLLANLILLTVWAQLKRIFAN